MSAAESDLVVEQAHEKAEHPEGTNTPRHHAQAGAALEELLAKFEHTHEPVIAVDMDDVLTQTNSVVAKCALRISRHVDLCQWLTRGWFTGHNEVYGTNMELKDFYCKFLPVSVLYANLRCSYRPIDYHYWQVSAPTLLRFVRPNIWSA